MGLFTWFAIYLTIWWTVLFCVLPLGVVSHAEAGIDRGDGTDPGSPVDPKLKRKFITTTLVSAALFGVLWVVIQTGIVPLPQFPTVR